MNTKLLAHLKQKLWGSRPPVSATDLQERAGRWLARKTFTTSDRLTLYEDMAFLLDNNLKISDALDAMLTSHDGKRPPAAFCIEDVRQALNQGKSIDIGLAQWIPRQEAAILSAGVQDGRLADALRRAMTVVRAMDEMKGTLLSTLFNPAMQMATTVSMMWMVYKYFIPTLTLLAPPERWTGSVWWLAHLSLFLVNNAVLLGTGTVALTVWIVWSLSNLTGSVRRQVLDKLLPWSLYRDIAGVSFLLNFSALMRAQVKTQEALERLSLHAGPWLYERLAATQRQVSAGDHLGLALRNAGYDFPSPESINKLVVLTSSDNAEVVIENFAHAWLTRTVARIKKVASFLSLASLLLMGGYMALIVIATQNLNALVGIH